MALEKTKSTITTKRGLSLVFGPVGTGKTTLARELAQRLEENPSVSYVFITNPNFPTPNQLLRAINQEFEVPQSSKSSRPPTDLAILALKLRAALGSGTDPEWHQRKVQQLMQSRGSVGYRI